MQTQYIFLALGWVIYFALHSLLASLKLKNYLNYHFPIISRYYRLVYNAWAILSLIFLLRWQFSFQEKTIWIVGYNQLIISYLLIFLGILIIMGAFKNYNLKEFSGLNAWQNTDNQRDTLKISGLNAYVRHPIYTGTLLFIVGFFFQKPSLANLLLSLIVLIYLDLGIRFEEAKLNQVFGEAYREYQKKVKKIIPFIY
jgi:protein-S-isoprenylcysteine O-methyltransferase Ste14